MSEGKLTERELLQLEAHAKTLCARIQDFLKRNPKATVGELEVALEIDHEQFMLAVTYQQRLARVAQVQRAERIYRPPTFRPRKR